MQDKSDNLESEGADVDVAAIEIRTAGDVLDAAQRFLRRLDRLAAVAERSGDVRGAVSAISAISKSLEGLFAKVHGLISEPIVNIDARRLEVTVDALPMPVLEIIEIAPTADEAAHAVRAIEELRRSCASVRQPLSGENGVLAKEPAG